MVSPLRGIFSNVLRTLPGVRLQLRRPVGVVQDPQTGQPSFTQTAILYNGWGFVLRYNRLSSQGLAAVLTGVAQNIPESLVLLPYCALPELPSPPFDVYLPNTRRVFQPLASPLDVGDQHEYWLILCKDQRPVAVTQ